MKFSQSAQELCQWHSSGRVAVDGMASNPTGAKNLAKIEASVVSVVVKWQSATKLA